MRVCLVSKELAPFHGWGVGTATAELAIALHAAGHEVHLLVDDLPGLRERAGLEFPGIRTHILPDPYAGLPHFPMQATRRPEAVYAALRPLHERHAFDVIAFNDFFADGYFAINAKRTLGEFGNAVLAVSLHSTILLLRHINAQPEFDLEIAAITHMEAESIRGADLLLSPSRAMLDVLSPLEGLAETLAGRGRPTVRVFPYALRPDTLGALPARGSAASREVLFFGRLEWRKGPDTLVRAVLTLLDEGVDVRARIVGVDTDAAPGRRSMRAYLQGLIPERWRDRFVFEDNVARAELAPRIGEAACCCFPARWDNYPNACLEAMAMGACVVASSGGGMAEMIEDSRQGLLVPPDDCPALAAALRRVLDDPSLRARLGGAAPARVAALCEPKAIAASFAEAVHAARGAKAGVGVSGEPVRVSVLIPCFNLGRTLPQTLASLRTQTRPPDETIVLDDGSTDSATLAYLASLAPTGVRVVRQDNRGLPAARNALAARASHPWLLFLDADDLLEPEFIATVAQAAARDPGLAMISSFMACFRDHLGATDKAPAPAEVGYVPLGAARDILPVTNAAASAIALVRRDALTAAGGYDETLGAFEDWDLWCRMLARGERIAIVPRFLIRNRIRHDSMLRTLSLVDQQHLRALLLTRHSGLASHPDRPLRILLGESCWAQERAARAESGGAPSDARAAELIRENLRYRIADQAHSILKRLGVAGAVKAAMVGAKN